MSAVLETAQFDTVEAALRFAFRQNRENYQATILNRMAGGPGQAGRGLGGLEGAAMAGSINRHVAALGTGHEAILRVKFGDRQERCRHCFDGTKNTEWWKAALADLTDFTATAFTKSHYKLRKTVIQRYYKDKECRRIELRELFKELGVPESTGNDHISKLKQFLNHHEGAALHAISVKLREAGIVYTAE